MWMGKASPRCSACMTKGRPGPWCLADRPCTFQSQGPPPLAGSRGIAGVGSTDTSFSHARTSSIGRRTASARSGDTAIGGTRSVPPSPKPTNRSGKPVGSPPPQQSGSRPSAGRQLSRKESREAVGSIVCRLEAEFQKELEALRTDFQKDLEMLRAVLNTQMAAWAQVEMAAGQIFCGGRQPVGVGVERNFQQLVRHASEQSTRLHEVFDHVVEWKTKGRENPQSADRESHLRAEYERVVEEKAEMTRQTMELHMERDELHLQREQMIVDMAECRKECERLIAEGKLEMNQKTGAMYAECGRTLEANQAEMTRQVAEFNAERERLDQEKAEMINKISLARSEAEAKMAQEERELAKRMTEFHEECERKVAEEKAVADRRLAEGRMQTEEQLRKERQVTNRIMHVLRDLPPLQTAMELGDLGLLGEELGKWKIEALPDHFGECKGVVEAVLKLARERFSAWCGVQHTWKEVLREVETLPGDLDNLTRQSQRIFRTLKESQLTMLDLRRSDPKAMDRICDVLLAWQQCAMAHSNHVQRLIVRKAVTCPQLGPFDFADLDICLRLVDRDGSEVFLSRARALVEDDRTAPQQLRPLLSHLETMLFFLKYTTSEDLQLTYAEFGKQNSELDPKIFEYLKWAERVYPPGSELVRISHGRDLMDGRNVASVLKELRKAPGVGKNDALGPFREIFYQWALAMHGTFNLLVLPHHTQVVCLLAFQRFFETTRPPHTLIAQVGTGEGKSMIIAALAIYVVVVLRKKAHVVVDDETLLERDFETFKRVFDAFEVPVDQRGTRKRPLSAVLCVSEERLAARTGDTFLLSRVDPEADVCYCEAKHVQSFYASVARGEKRDFEGYEERVLILDEVDALVIDEEPNDVFVYPNEELSKMATLAAGALAQGNSPEDVTGLRNSSHPAASRVISEMVKEWTRGKEMVAGEDFVYMKEVGKYCVLHAGRANAKSWSLALECRNFQDRFSQEILFQERLFVTSRPRVFRKYHRIVGLSGSIGSKPEQAFLRDTYGAVFMKVPPFLTTCRGSPFHEAVPVRLGHQQRIVYVEPTPEAHLARLAEVALDAREKVPVLIIARDRAHADHLVDRLRHVARSRGMGVLSEDIIRPLSRTLYEANPQQWKENLNRATLPLGEGGRSWRITVADPRGGRGTDYRVDDQAVDARGGLLLIPTVVPTSRREWTQFLGRTARQDCKGQFCCVLCADDYTSLSKKYHEALHADGVDGGLGVIEAILRWGDREAAERIRGSAALYNCGVRMNELCEEVFSRRSDILMDPASREHIVDTCQRFRWMSVREVDKSFGRLYDFDPAKIVTEACDLGRPAEPPVRDFGTPRRLGVQNGSASTHGPPKIVVFCLDWSASMMSHDTGTRLSRFETCVACILQILQDQVRDCDFVGVVVFGPNVQLVVPPMQKGTSIGVLQGQISSLRPQMSGGTCFFDAVAQCLQLLNKPDVGSPELRRWLVCLTDGDDLGSQPQNERGQLVTRLLAAGVPKPLNLLVVTVGTLKVANVKIIEAWVHRVCTAGGIGRLLSEKSAATIAKAFHVVAEYLAVEVGGETEC